MQVLSSGDSDACSDRLVLHPALPANGPALARLPACSRARRIAPILLVLALVQIPPLWQETVMAQSSAPQKSAEPLTPAQMNESC